MLLPLKKTQIKKLQLVIKIKQTKFAVCRWGPIEVI